jgi:hypothetical protein
MTGTAAAAPIIAILTQVKLKVKLCKAWISYLEIKQGQHGKIPGIIDT